MSDITKQSLTELVENIKNKKLSSSEVTKAFIERSEKSKIEFKSPANFLALCSSTEILDNLEICFIVLRSMLICYLNNTKTIT